MIISGSEAANVYKKKSDALVRVYTDQICPYKPKQKFTLQIERDGRLEPFAYCTVRSVRPLREGDYEVNPDLAKGEGYSSFDAWKLNVIVPIAAHTPEPILLHRITFNVDKLHEQLLKEQMKKNAQSRKKPL